MATAQNVIDRASVILSIVASGGSLATDDASRNTEVFTALQHLMSEWAEDGLIAIPAPSATSDVLVVPEGTIRALAYNLAADVSAEFGKQLGLRTLQIAEDTKDRLESAIDIDIGVDMSDLSFTMGERYNINNDR